MKKLFTTLFALGLLFPIGLEAGFSPEGRSNRPRDHYPEGRPRKKKRCKKNGGVVVCRMPKPKKCTLRKPCIPKGYYRNNPPRIIPNK